MPRNSAEAFVFEGFAAPHYTQVPDEVFDLLLPMLSEAELKVLLYIIRRTFGFKKAADEISISQLVSGILTKDGRRLDNGAGVSKSSAIRGVKGLVEKGIIVATKNRSVELGDEANTYKLHLREAENSTPPPVSQIDTGVTVPVSQIDTRGAIPVSQIDTGVTVPVSQIDTGGSVKLRHPRVSNLDTQQTVIQQTVIQQTDNDSNRNAPKKKRVNAKTPTPDADQAPATNEPEQADPPYSPYIAGVIIDFSRELGDVQISSNVSQALRLWQLSGLDEGIFVQKLYEAKLRTRKAQSAGLGNKGAYMFMVLRDILGLRT